MEKNKQTVIGILVFLVTITAVLSICGCDSTTPTSNSGYQKVDSKSLGIDTSGQSVEQMNVGRRLKEDANPGAIKYLYVVSPMSGQPIYHSVVKGKVTSSGKRLNPYTTTGSSGTHTNGFYIDSNTYLYTNEIIQDDGTYGTSIDYLYWWDVKDVYNQMYPSGAVMVLITGKPVSFNGVTMTTEISQIK